MLKRFVALACTLMLGAAFFVTTVGCGDDKKPPAAPNTPADNTTKPEETKPAAP